MPRPEARGTERTGAEARLNDGRAVLGACGACLLTLPATLSAQAPPATEIYLAGLSVLEGEVSVGTPVNVTRRPGYDNQPAFSRDGRSLLYTSYRGGQADTYRWDLAARGATRVTETPESEYSPTPIPGDSGFSVVRVEADSAQRLWRFEPDGSGPALLLPEIEPVGYHAWAGPDAVALYVLGDPPTLRVARPATGETERVTEAVGRSLRTVPDRETVTFVQRTGDGARIVELDPATGDTTRLTPALAGSEDHAWAGPEILLMASGSRLHAWRRGGEEGWREVADLSSFGVEGITRLAVSPGGGRLALVAREREEGR